MKKSKAKKSVAARKKKSSGVRAGKGYASIEAILKKRLAQLAGGVRRRKKITTRALPKDWSEAARIKTDVGVVETLGENQARELAAVREALKRIRQGTYGICAGCRQRIPAERLKARPHSVYCVGCKTLREGLSRS